MSEDTYRCEQRGQVKLSHVYELEAAIMALLLTEDHFSSVSRR